MTGTCTTVPPLHGGSENDAKWACEFKCSSSIQITACTL